MKGILIAGVFAAFAITVIDSLNCRQCSSIVEGTEGTESCPSEPKECPSTDPEAVSCVESSVSSTLGGSQSLNHEMYCSPSNCEDITQADFTVHVSDTQQFHFASQCCETDPCPDDNNKEDSGSRTLTNTQCPSCYRKNTESCKEETRQCSEGEQCVHIIFQYGSGDNPVTEELKGCSDISDATCKALGESGEFGAFTFQTVDCTNATTISVTTTPTTVTTTPTTVTTTPTTVTTTPETDSSTSIKASVISSVFGSLLLLKLLF